MANSLDYQTKLKLLSDITTLGINSKKYNAKKPNFSRSEKIKITRYYNYAKESGFFGVENQRFIPKVKLVKSKKKKAKGFPGFGGYFIQGAAPDDKIRGGRIIKDNFEKTFIPMDFENVYDEIIEEWVEEYNQGATPAEFVAENSEELIDQIIFEAITPYYEELSRGDYFTIVLQNGWEVGRGQSQKWKSKKGQAIAEDLEGEAKLKNLSEKINELLSRAVAKYQTTKTLVSGVYLYQFLNQRKPNNKERKIINGKNKRKTKKKNKN